MADTSQQWICQFLASSGHSGLPQLRPVLEISGLHWDWGRSTFQHPHLWGQHKTITMQTEQSGLLASSQGPRKVQQWVADLPKRSLLETRAATRFTLCGRDATCDIEIDCTLTTFCSKTQRAWIGSIWSHRENINKLGHRLRNHFAHPRSTWKVLVFVSTLHTNAVRS